MKLEYLFEFKFKIGNTYLLLSKQIKCYEKYHIIFPHHRRPRDLAVGIENAKVSPLPDIKYKLKGILVNFSISLDPVANF